MADTEAVGMVSGVRDGKRKSTLGDGGTPGAQNW